MIGSCARYRNDKDDDHVECGQFLTNALSVRCIKDDKAENILMDDRGQVTRAYKTVKIGTQTWMAENLDYTSNWVKGICADEQCSGGRYYTWLEATEEHCADLGGCPTITDDSKVQGICPSGWRLPSKDDFEALYYNVEINDGKNVENLKSVSGWTEISGGTDTYGFSAYPMGVYDSVNDKFKEIGSAAFFWSTTPAEAEESYYGFALSDQIEFGALLGSFAAPIRCIKE